jgi:hypothetical protein
MCMRTLATVFSISFLVSCGPTGASCKVAGDCPSKQACIQNACRATNGSGSAGGSAGSGAAGGDNSGTGGNVSGTGGGDINGGPGGGSVLSEPDAGPPVLDGGCGLPMPGNPTIKRLCATPTNNECQGATDIALAGANVPASRRNGTSGNGFDDDCDGLVDEGCECPGNGLTKDCYLVPATQVSPATGLPVGWCGANSKGSLDCRGSEFGTWSGLCRGAQPPVVSDSCSPGDFNCDGLDSNNALEGCVCPGGGVTCPTAPITVAPYPNPTQLAAIDGNQWVIPSKQTQTTNWVWTVLGGDCDNVLPNPTFAIYNNTDSTRANTRRGVRTPVVLQAAGGISKYVAGNSPLISIQDPAAGNGVGGGKIYPAFGLSGDYIVQGEFSLAGKQYVCTQKVQVRAPGIRAELCWDTVGGVDIDLHFARLQGATCTNDNGWALTCTSNGNPSRQDCYYNDESGCVNVSTSPPGWGYSNSPDSSCFGWSSKRSIVLPIPGNPIPLPIVQRCTNPRLDRDNVSCNRGQADPTGFDFCGPENTNLDNPKNGDTFAVGANHYAGDAANHPHVNLYCNGERVLSVGYNPATGQNLFPLLDTAGKDTTGDFWNVATIKANVNAAGTLTSCNIATIPSRRADTNRDGARNATGGNALCVEHGQASRRFIDTGTTQNLPQGGIPTAPSNWCKH